MAYNPVNKMLEFWNMLEQFPFTATKMELDV